MRDFPAAFTVELSRPGCMPYWLLQLTVGSDIYYLSDNDRYIAALSAQAYGAVKSFGSLREGIANMLDGFRVAEYTVELLLQVPVSAGGMLIETLANAGSLDDIPADLYLGLDGIAVVPQLISPGFVRDFGTQTDTTLPLMIQDKTVLLERTFIGRKVSDSDYPLAASADVGKVIPIPFNSLPKSPALALVGGVETTLKTASAIGATSLYLSDLSRITVGMVLLTDAEQKTVTSVGTYTVGVTAMAAAHAQGAAVIQLTTQVYAGADRAVNAIDKVWLRKNDLDLDITSYVTRYTGQVGSQLAGYGAMAVATIAPAGMAAIMALAQLGLTDTIATDAQPQVDAISFDNYTMSGSINYPNSIIDGVFQNGTDFLAGATMYLYFAKAVSRTGAPTRARICMCGGHALYPLAGFNFYLAGTQVANVTVNSTTPYTIGRSAWFNFTNWANLNLANTFAYISLTARGWAWEVWLEVECNPSASSTATPGVAKTGTVTLTGSNISSTFGSGKIFMDLAADSGTPTGVCNWILAQVGLPAVQVTGNLIAASFAGLINEYQTALWWLNYLAFQAGAWFMMPTGTPRLVSRAPGNPVRIITACVASEDGRRALTRKRTDIVEVLDKIIVLYNRDWSKSRGANAYNGTTQPAGAGSRERPELFQFDHIVDVATAIALRDFYLVRQQNRHSVDEIDTWIDQADLESGDTLQLAFLGNVVGIVIPAEHAPGSMDRADIIKLSVLV